MMSANLARESTQAESTQDSRLDSSRPLLHAQNLSAHFGEFALRDVSLEVFARERVAIIGESGSGKSLLAKLLLGLVETHEQSGAITLAGTRIDLDKSKVDSAIWRSLRAKVIAYIPQSPKLALNPLHSVQKQLEEMLLLHAPDLAPNPAAQLKRQAWHMRPKRQSHREMIDEALASVGLDPAIKSRLPHMLSGGEAQRVCIAMMSMLRPQILICDEPTTALDAHIQRQILELLDSLSDVAIVFISHDLALVERFAKRVYVMKDGRIVDRQTNAMFKRAAHSGQKAKGEPAALHPYTQMLLDALTLPKARLESNGESNGESNADSNIDSGVDSGSSGALALRVQNFSVYHTRKGLFTTRSSAISGVSFMLPVKSSLGIIGASGSGKSSLALGILGLESSSGTLEVRSQRATNGRRIYPTPKRDREFVQSVQIVFQDPLLALNPRMCVLETLQEALDAAHCAKAFTQSRHNLAPHPTPRADTKASRLPQLAQFWQFAQVSRNSAQASMQEALALLKSVGLSERFAYRYTQDLSGGEAQRVCIARALASGASVLLLDEPTSALDKSTQREIIILLQQLQQQRGLSYVVISHDLDVIEAMCAEVLVVDSGRVVEQGAIEKVFANPKHAYTKLLLAAYK